MDSGFGHRAFRGFKVYYKAIQNLPPKKQNYMACINCAYLSTFGIKSSRQCEILILLL